MSPLPIRRARTAAPFAAAALLLAGSIAVPPGAARAAVAPFTAPTPTVRTLPNGLTVAVFQDERLPLVQIQILVAAGSAHEPSGEAGVANLAFQMLAQGTASRSGAEYDQAVQALGGSIGGSVSREFTAVNGAFLIGDMEAGMELLADAILNPLFDEFQLQAVKNQIAAGLAGARRNPVTLADEHLWSAVFGDDPYGRPVHGGPRALMALSATQVRSFHRNRYRPDRALLAIAGDVTPERAFKAAEALLGNWGGRVKDETPAEAAAPAAGWRVRIVDAPALARAELRLGAAGPAGAAADHEALAVAAEMMAAGIGPPARIGLSGMVGPGLFSIATVAPVDSAGAEVARMRGALAQALAQPASGPALDGVKRTMAARHAFQFETLSGVIAQWMSAALLGVTDDGPARYPGRIAAVTAEGARTALARHVPPDRLVLVAVGPADRLRPQLERLGPVEVVAGEQAAEVVVMPSTALVPPTPSQVARGRALAGRMVAAHGGLERLRGIKDSTLEGDVIVTPGPREHVGKVLQVRKDPDRFLFSLSISVIQSTQVLDGPRGWTRVGDETGPVEDMDSTSVAGLRAGNRSDLRHLLLAAADPASVVAWRGRERRDERDTEVLEVVSAEGERRVLFMDVESHRLVGMEQNDGGHSARRVYRDLRPVNGVLWPFGEDRLTDGQRTMSITLTRVAFNTGVRDALFRRPGATPAVPPKAGAPPRAR